MNATPTYTAENAATATATEGMIGWGTAENGAPFALYAEGTEPEVGSVIVEVRRRGAAATRSRHARNRVPGGTVFENVVEHVGKVYEDRDGNRVRRAYYTQINAVSFND